MIKQKSANNFQDNPCCIERAAENAFKHVNKQKHINIEHNYDMQLAEECKI